MKDLYRAIGIRHHRPSVGLGRAGLHLGALSSFAIAWQYLQPLGDTGELFVQHGLEGWTIALFAVGLLAGAAARALDR